MELTIEQALQQGITAHKEGKLQDAERLYRAILKSQPAHPTANHNLGTIALSSDKAESALPFFKSAVEANPSVGQFWLSYIQALINAKKLDDAQQALEQAREGAMNSVSVVKGESPAPMAGDSDIDADLGTGVGDDDIEGGDADIEGGDDFGASEPAAGGDEPAGRAER